MTNKALFDERVLFDGKGRRLTMRHVGPSHGVAAKTVPAGAAEAPAGTVVSCVSIN